MEEEEGEEEDGMGTIVGFNAISEWHLSVLPLSKVEEGDGDEAVAICTVDDELADLDVVGRVADSWCCCCC